MVLNFILILLFILSTLLILSIDKTLVNKERVNEILKYLRGKPYHKFYGKNCYYSAIGLKKQYPSYPCKLEIFLTDSEIIFIGRNKFPFIFKTIQIPFVLCENPNSTRKNLKLARIFKPTKAHLNKNLLNFIFTDSIAFNTVIDYQIELENQEQIEKLQIVSEWS